MWAGISLAGAVSAIALTGAAVSLFNGEEPPQREVRKFTGISTIFVLHTSYDFLCLSGGMLTASSWPIFLQQFIVSSCSSSYANCVFSTELVICLDDIHCCRKFITLLKLRSNWLGLLFFLIIK